MVQSVDSPVLGHVGQSMVCGIKVEPGYVHKGSFYNSHDMLFGLFLFAHAAT